MTSSATPFVSVIVPVFNDQPGVDRCVKALSTQSYPVESYEVIIVDNGSNPPICIATEAAGHVQLLNCDETGSYAARNVGISKSRGEILAFIDADCVAERDWLRNGVAALLSNDSECIVGGGVQFQPTAQLRATELYQTLAGFPQETNVTERGFAATANMLAPKSCFDRVGLFNTELLSGGDIEWCLRARQQDIEVVYCGDAAVLTTPRSDLRSAIRQARRVAGGRYHLQRSGLAKYAGDKIRSHRAPFSAVSWILNQRQASLFDRLRILAVASVIKLAQILEVLRLRLGGRPERR